MWSWRPFPLASLFQITPIQLITTAASIVNGGTRITPHFGVKAVAADGSFLHRFSYPEGKRILSEETSKTMRYVLEQVVAEGSGKKAAVAGFRIGGKTATSEKASRSLKNIFPPSSVLLRRMIPG